MSITDHFYHGTTRKLIVAFGTLFNNIKVLRSDSTEITVPLTYASKEKFYLTLKQNEKLDRIGNMILPRMGFIITDIGYAFERKQSSIGKFHAKDDNDTSIHKRMYLPVPYDIQIELSIYSRNMEDGLQILEQIIPFFKPSFNITINELDSMGVLRDIPIILDSISHEDTSEGDLTEGIRLLRWDLSFTIKANFYGPVGDQKIIKRVFVDYHTSKDGEYQDKIDERYYVEPDPYTATIDDIWEFNEEILSNMTSDNNTILKPEDVILRENQSKNIIHINDNTQINIT